MNVHNLSSAMVIRQKSRPDIEMLCEKILQGDHSSLGQGITLIESRLKEDEARSELLLSRLLPFTGNSLRIGITGVPGVGKSTFIEALGGLVTSADKKVAVLAIDPSSESSHGSILGDKTRMGSLSQNVKAYIRPSPAGGALGGVADKTRESVLLCEAAGFDLILIETVGVGQSETLVRGMVDVFLLLVLAGAGDELQGVKRGIMEMADIIAVNKDDGDNTKSVRKSVGDLLQSVALLTHPQIDWKIPIVSCSSTENRGIQEVWNQIVKYEALIVRNGHKETLRAEQNLYWMQQKLDRLLRDEFSGCVGDHIEDMKKRVVSRELTPILAAKQLFEFYLKQKGG